MSDGDDMNAHLQSNSEADELLLGGSDNLVELRPSGDTTTRENKTASHGLGNAKPTFESLKKLKNPKLLGITAVFIMLAGSFAHPTSREVLSNWYNDTVAVPVFQNGDVALPEWKIRLNKMEESTLATVQNVNSELADLRTGVSSAEAARSLSQQAMAEINSLTNSVTALNASISTMQARMNQLESDLIDIAVAKPDVDLKPFENGLKQLSGDVGDLAQLVERNTKNSGWFANRLSELEKWQTSTIVPVKALSDGIATDQAQQAQVAPRPVPVEIQERNAWELRAASSQGSVAWLMNSFTGEKLRVTKGVDVPRCGPVTAIIVAEQVVKTDTCTIAKG